MAYISVARIFDPGPIAPVVEIDNNLGVYTQGAWRFYKVAGVEGLYPAGGGQIQQNLGAVAAGLNTAVTEITVARADNNAILHVRCAPLDPVALDVFSGQNTGGRAVTYSTKARVTMATANLDPNFASTTMFVYGNQRSIFMSAYNTLGFDLAQSRVMLWGFSYRVYPIAEHQISPGEGGITQAMNTHLKDPSATLSEGQRKLIENFKVTLVQAEAMP